MTEPTTNASSEDAQPRAEPASSNQSPDGSTTPAAVEFESPSSAQSAPPTLSSGAAPPASEDAEGTPSDATAEASAVSVDSSEKAAEPEATANGENGKPTPESQAEHLRAKRKRRKRRKKQKELEGKSERAPRTTRTTEHTPFHVGEEVFGKVTAVLETAIMVDLSGKALAIFDRSEMEPDDLVPSVGDRIVAQVHNDGGRGGLVVLTRKPLREEDAKVLVEKAAEDGSLVSGLITGVIKGGVDVDIGGLRAFAPSSGMDLHPANANFESIVGQRLDFKVTQYDRNGRDVVVTRRPMLEKEAHARRKQALELLQPDQVVKAVVRSIVDWGVFVSLPAAENLDGLLHISEASHDLRTKLPELFKAGDEVEVKIVKIDERGKIWLSRKALLENPWAHVLEKYPARSVHTGKVVRLEPFGAFVELEPGLDGLVHVTDLGLKRGVHPSETLEMGQELQVLVHHYDSDQRRITLHPAPSGEQAAEEPQQVHRNAIVEVEISKADNPGLNVRLLGVTGRTSHGFIPAGQTGTPRGTDLRKKFPVGTRLKAKVLDLDPRRGEPKLSIRAMEDEEERRAHKEYRQKLQRESKFGTLGDLLRDHLAKTSK